MMAVSFRPEDRVFVQIAIDECTKLNLPKYAPTALVWNSKLPIDQPFLHQSYLFMPEGLNGKILPQDARPLIMSAILQKQRVKRYNPPNRLFALFLAVSFGSLIVAIVASIVISKALGYGSVPDDVGGGIGLGWLLSSFIESFFLGRKNNRNQRLESDLQVAYLIGSDLILQTLRKIEGLNLYLQRGRLRMLVSTWPTLSQRIANLKNPTIPLPIPLPRTEKDAFEAFQKKWGLNKQPQA